MLHLFFLCLCFLLFLNKFWYKKGQIDKILSESNHKDLIYNVPDILTTSTISSEMKYWTFSSSDIFQKAIEAEIS